VKFKSPEKQRGGATVGQVASEYFLKQQAYKLEECTTQINNMLRDKNTSQGSIDMSLDWSSSVFSQNDSIIEEKDKH
jgi:hypothetical protein